MRRLSPLPERLRYLQPFRKQVAKLKPEEIDESMDLSLLNKLLLDRIKGIPTAEGKEKLEADYEVLEKWLSSSDLNDNGGMSFLQGHLMALPELVDRLLEEKDKPEPAQNEVQMEFPPEAKIKKLRCGLWKVRWLNTTILVQPSDKQYIDFQIKEFHEDPPGEPFKVTMTSVKFREVAGFKRLVYSSIVGTVHLDYALIVPGGYVSVTLLKKGATIDAEKFESYFHTIRIAQA